MKTPAESEAPAVIILNWTSKMKIVQSRPNSPENAENLWSICFFHPKVQAKIVKMKSSLSLNQQPLKMTSISCNKLQTHSLIRGVLIQSCSARAKNFTNYVFCPPQFGGVIQNIENRCAILTLFVYVDYYQNNQFYIVKLNF